MRRVRRGDIGGPLVTILIAVAALAIAAVVITYGFNILGMNQKPLIDSAGSFVIENGTIWEAHIIVQNPGSSEIEITKVQIKDDNNNLVEGTIVSGNVIDDGAKGTVVAQFSTGEFGGKTSYEVIVSYKQGSNTETITGTAQNLG